MKGPIYAYPGDAPGLRYLTRRKSGGGIILPESGRNVLDAEVALVLLSESEVPRRDCIVTTDGELLRGRWAGPLEGERPEGLERTLYLDAFDQRWEYWLPLWLERRKDTGPSGLQRCLEDEWSLDTGDYQTWAFVRLYSWRLGDGRLLWCVERSVQLYHWTDECNPNEVETWLYETRDAAEDEYWRQRERLVNEPLPDPDRPPWWTGEASRDSSPGEERRDR